jgi:hypothetical protein
MSPSSSFSGSPFGGSTRTLRKTSSFADLAKRQLRRFKSKGDFDFGCQGDHNQEIVEEEPEEEEVQEVRAFFTSLVSITSLKLTTCTISTV